VTELSKLADMLQAGMLSREEFDQLKIRLINGRPGRD
jgi:Short C-terminal domain